jgi:hypothetical protein
MNIDIKEINKWFAENSEVGEIDDATRLIPGFDWGKMSQDKKLAFYESFNGRVKKQLKNIKTEFPNIKVRVITSSIQTLEGYTTESNSSYVVEGSGSAEIIQAYVKYGLLAPLPHTLILKHNDEELEAILAVLEDCFSRGHISGEGKEKERLQLWDKMAGKSLSEVKEIRQWFLDEVYSDRPLALGFC